MSIPNLQIHRIAEHSRKPNEIRKQIVELYGDIPRIELFARERLEGFDVWGNETTKFNKPKVEGSPRLEEGSEGRTSIPPTIEMAGILEVIL